MGRGVYARRTDTNQKEIVAALRAHGCSVWITASNGQPGVDLVVGLKKYNGDRVNLLMEIKDGEKPLSQQKLTACEQKFFNAWKGQVTIIRSVGQAIDYVTACKAQG